MVQLVKMVSVTVVLLFVFISAGNCIRCGNAYAASAEEINIGVDEALQGFKKEVRGGTQFLGRAKGVLVFPSVIKAGFGIGGEYGEGALRVGGATVAYYNTAAASIGFQMGAQSKTVVLVFMTTKALSNFR